MDFGRSWAQLWVRVRVTIGCGHRHIVRGKIIVLPGVCEISCLEAEVCALLSAVVISSLFYTILFPMSGKYNFKRNRYTAHVTKLKLHINDILAICCSSNYYYYLHSYKKYKHWKTINTTIQTLIMCRKRTKCKRKKERKMRKLLAQYTIDRISPSFLFYFRSFSCVIYVQSTLHIVVNF